MDRQQAKDGREARRHEPQVIGHPPPASVLRQPALFIATLGGAGLARRAPGTAGTAVSVPVLLVLAPLGLPVYYAVLVAAFLLGWWACAQAERRLGFHDHPAVVWDELVGYLLTALPALHLGWEPGWALALSAFVAFRFCDILKPWPVSLADRRLGGGLGTMVDDMLAAGYAAALLLAGRAWLVPLF